jgi:2-oxo-4-hydroxy-4-carboxy-5-ureidoimidazoline decarboxylase
VFEHAPWVAQRVTAQRPFQTVASLDAAMMEALRGASDSEVRAFLNGHPELSGDNLPTDLTDASQAEQSALGMAGTSGAAELAGLNRAYRDRFGFPFIICVARHTAANVLRSLQHRLRGDPADELQTSLAEIGHITRLRLLQRVHGAGAPPSAGRLSGHVLDVASGRPAPDLRVDLLQEGRRAVQALTDADGRVSGLLPPGPLRQGQYELEFHAGAYFAARDVATFYDLIPVRFTISEAEAHYHIPLLLAPFGYSTYRGS